MKYFKQFLKQYKGKVILALFLLLGQVVGTLLIPALIGKVVDDGILRKDMDMILQIGGLMVVVAIVATGISVWGSFATSDLGALFGKAMRTKLFRKTQALSLQQFDEIGVSSLITRSTSDITNLQQTLGMMLQMVVPAPIIIIVSMVMTGMVSISIALVQLGFMIVLLLFATIILKKSEPLSQSIQTRLDCINKVVRESIIGVRVIRAFGNETYEEGRSGETFQDYAKHMIRLNRLFAIFSPIVWMLMGALMVIILWMGGFYTMHGTMAVGEITAVSEYAILTMAYLMMAVSTLTTIPKARACLSRLESVLDSEDAIQDALAQDESIDLQAAAIAFHHVSFAYPGAEEAVIQDVTFNVTAGQTTAIIGSTGSGKSTIADLLLRLHDVMIGTIKIYGVDIRKLSQQSLRNKIGSVPQKAFLFSGTIAENLRMGDAEASDETLWQALAIAQAETFVKELPLGLEAPVSQGGTNFSGGQRQRLAIARALVKQADIFLFDDSFSALDVKTDANLRQALHSQVSKPAKLIIAQRISSIMDADQILVLDEGKLIGVGTHDELVSNCSVYKAIADSQMNKEVS